MSKPPTHIICVFLINLLIVGYPFVGANLYALQDVEPLPQKTDSLSNASADSAISVWSDGADYEIQRLRLIRFLRKNKQNLTSSTIKSAGDLLIEAQNFAKQKDYATAKLLVDSAFELVEAMLPSKILSSSDGKNQISFPKTEPKSNWKWAREILTGVDLWRYEFEGASILTDVNLTDVSSQNIFVESSGNPYAGVRINLNKGGVSQSNFDANAVFKTSRDYSSGDLELRLQQGLGKTAQLRLEDRLESTRYRGDFNLQYWQNTGSLAMAKEFGDHFEIEIEDELRLRRYQTEDEFYPNYIQNEIGLGGAYSSGLTTRLQARYNYILRGHHNFSDDDFREHRIIASLSQNTDNNTAIYIENIWRNRIYPRGFSDSTYQNTFHEEYIRTDLKVGLSQSTAIRLEGNLSLRQYEISSGLTPDFLYAKVNPKLEFNLVKDLEFSLGYIFLLRLHGTNDDNPSLTATDFNTGFLVYEDYYSNGITFGLDLFKNDGFLLSLSEVYEIRTYPNSQSKSIPGLGLYSDRNINSLLLFMSWSLTSKWQVGAVANLDNDKSRTDDASDSQTTLFSLDLSYSF